MRRTVCFAIVTAGVVALSPAAHAQLVSSEASMSPTTLRPGKTLRVDYRLRLVTGEAPAEVRVGLDVPEIGHGVAGVPVRLRKPYMAGPGVVSAVQTVFGDYAYGACVRGFTEGIDTAFVSLPPRSRTTLVVPAYVMRTGPWPQTDYRLTFQLAGRALRPQRPRLLGRRAPRLMLRTPPGGVAAPTPPGTRILISGRMARALAGRVVGLFARRAGGRARLIARVRTDRRGRFRHWWRATRRGGYSVYASFGGDRRFTPDRSCSGDVNIG